MSAPSTIRMWIIASTRKILAGGTFTWADWEAQPHQGWHEIEPKRFFLARSDRHPAYFAWQALRWWADDDDIRTKDPEYGKMRKRQLQDLLRQMELSDGEAAGQTRPLQHRDVQAKIGDRVVVVGLPDELPAGMATRELFEKCVGRTFVIVGLQDGLAELEVGEVLGEPPYMHSIWIELNHLHLRSSDPSK